MELPEKYIIGVSLHGSQSRIIMEYVIKCIVHFRTVLSVILQQAEYTHYLYARVFYVLFFLEKTLFLVVAWRHG